MSKNIPIFRFLIGVILLCFQSAYCENQYCTFEYRHWTTKGVGGLYYTCSISNTTLTVEPVVTKTSNNLNSNQKVTAIHYSSGSDLKFIPNSVFDVFANLQFFLMASVNLKNLKQNYFKNANSLKGIQINGNPITSLEENLFVKAPRLEGINLGGNQITSIHKLAFNGLLKLQWIELHSNKITSLSPWTFTSLSNLQFLKLVGNECINQNFQNSKEIFNELEIEIKKSCVYQVDVDQYFLASLTELVMKLSVENDQIHTRLNKMEEKAVTDNKDLNEKLENFNKMFDDRIKKLENDFEAKTALALTIVEEKPLSKYISVEESSPAILEKISKKVQNCEENILKIETVSLKKFESITKLIVQSSKKFDTKVKDLEQKVSKSNVTEMRRKLNAFIDQVQTKLDDIDEKAFKDKKAMEKFSSRVEQPRARTSGSVSIDFEENFTKSLKKTNEELKKLEETLIQKTDKFTKDYAKDKSQMHKELEFVIQKININTQTCEANFTKVDAQASKNSQALLSLSQRITSSNANLEIFYKSLSMKVESNNKKYISNVSILKDRIVKVDKDLQSVKADLNKRRN